MIKNLLAVFTLLFITGCSSISAVRYFDNKSALYAQNMVNTKIEKIIVDNKVETLINITYLNPSKIKKLDENTQNFLVGVYYTNENSSATKVLLNTKQYISKEKVEKNHYLYENIPQYNKWADYHIYRFKDTKSVKLKLQISNKTLGSKTVIFDKY